jgi:streptomycin 6-kinase
MSIAIERIERVSRPLGHRREASPRRNFHESHLVDARPLHADIHHDTIIHGSRGWLVIDPKGVFGDPAFEAANVFYNPLHRDDLCLEPTRIARLAETFSQVLDQSPVRLLDYAFAYGYLSASWHAQDGNPTEEARELAVAAAIGELRTRM